MILQGQSKKLCITDKSSRPIIVTFEMRARDHPTAVAARRPTLQHLGVVRPPLRRTRQHRQGRPPQAHRDCPGPRASHGRAAGRGDHDRAGRADRHPPGHRRRRHGLASARGHRGPQPLRDPGGQPQRDVRPGRPTDEVLATINHTRRVSEYHPLRIGQFQVDTHTLPYILLGYIAEDADEFYGAAADVVRTLRDADDGDTVTHVRGRSASSLVKVSPTQSRFMLAFTPTKCAGSRADSALGSP